MQTRGLLRKALQKRAMPANSIYSLFKLHSWRSSRKSQFPFVFNQQHVLFPPFLLLEILMLDSSLFPPTETTQHNTTESSIKHESETPSSRSRSGLEGSSSLRHGHLLPPHQTSTLYRVLIFFHFHLLNCFTALT